MKDSQDKKIINVSINGVFNMSVGTVVTFYTTYTDTIWVGDVICDKDVCYTVKGFIFPNGYPKYPGLISAIVERVIQ